jgi:hypothetical protein
MIVICILLFSSCKNFQIIILTQLFMLHDFFKSNENCLSCVFYSRYFKQYNYPLVLRAYNLPDSNYSYGMKPCVKKKEFVWFNEVCVNISQLPAQPLKTKGNIPANIKRVKTR